MAWRILLIDLAQGSGGQYCWLWFSVIRLGMMVDFLGFGICGGTRASGLWLRGPNGQQA